MDSGAKVLAMMAMMASPAMASCAYGTRLQPRQEDGTVEVNTFGYIGPTGPTNWVNLDPAENALCATGTEQSPIDFIPDALTVVPAAELDLQLSNMPEGTEFENLGTTVEVVVEGQNTMHFGGIEYELQQFHFHLPSEHLDDGQSLAMEMHMVWEGPNAEVGVIGMFIDLDDGGVSGDNDEVESSVPSNTTEPVRRASVEEKKRRREAVQGDNKESRQLPTMEDTFFHVNAPTTAATTPSNLLETVLGSVEEITEPGSVTQTQPLDMVELGTLLNAGSFHTYEGSLTTPPCSEGVRWLFSDQKLSIQTSTFLKARSVIGFNSRFPQSSLGKENILSAAQ